MTSRTVGEAGDGGNRCSEEPEMTERGCGAGDALGVNWQRRRVAGEIEQITSWATYGENKFGRRGRGRVN